MCSAALGWRSWAFYLLLASGFAEQIADFGRWSSLTSSCFVTFLKSFDIEIFIIDIRQLQVYCLIRFRRRKSEAQPGFISRGFYRRFPQTYKVASLGASIIPSGRRRCVTKFLSVPLSPSMAPALKRCATGFQQDTRTQN